jgi:uncharacterized protein (DUF1697 family)
MPRYVAFLRGINVGGRAVKKEKLLEVFNNLNFQGVVTFKQSGNVIFETSDVNIEAVKGKIESCLRAALGYEVKVFIRTVAQLKTLVEADPFRGQNSAGSSFLITFLDTLGSFPLPLPAVIPKSTAQVIAVKGTEVYSVTHGGGEGALPNPFVEKQLGAKATTRNLNVIGEIVENYS